MRAIFTAYLFVALAAFVWAVQTPAAAYWSVRTFGQSGADYSGADEALISLGANALPALQRGFRSANPNTRLHCAKIMMILGENDGEAYLLQQLQAHPDFSDGAGRAAEAMLFSAWDIRDGPSETCRKRLRAFEHAHNKVPETMIALNDCLTRFPNWADGYARRAKLYQRAGEVYEAKRDAIAALACAPNHFEALVTLGRIQLMVDDPRHAFKCFERAVMIDPRLKDAVRDDVGNTLKALDAEKQKRLEEKRKNALAV